MIINKAQEKELEVLINEAIDNDIRPLLISNVDSDDINNIRNAIKDTTIQFLINNRKSKV